MEEYQINWSNIDLNSAYKRSLNLLDPYSFETLLLELHCNIPNEKLTKEEIQKHAKSVLLEKYQTAIEILNDNIDNILKYEQEQRKES
jgi:hypothetical protein